MGRKNYRFALLVIGIVFAAVYATAAIDPALLLPIVLVVFVITALVIMLILWSTNPRRFQRQEERNAEGSTTVYFSQGKAVYHQLYKKAITALQQGNTSEAKQLFDRFMYLEPKNPLAHMGLGFYYRNDDIVTAEQYFQAAHDLDPKFILPLTWLGYIAYQRAKFHEGIDYFERALRLEKKLPEAYLGLGYCYEQLNDHPKALRYFEQYVQLVPHSVEAAEIRNRIAEYR
jgi:tetratricopeptide (TPR) repeat protein